MGSVSIFMLGNSWVGQNSRSFELYFLIYLEWTMVSVAGRAQPKKREYRAKHPGPIDRSLCPIDQRAKASPLFWEI